MFHITKAEKERGIFIFFEVNVIAKGLHALLEVLGGILVTFLSKDFVIQVVSWFTDDELSASPKNFIVFYLLSHGILKGILAWGLFREKLWSYPASLAVFSFFILSQLARFTYTLSPWLILFTVIDVVFLWLVWHEYKLVRKLQVS